MITLPPEFAVNLVLQPIDDLVETVAGLLGEPGDIDGRMLAVRCLQEGADQLNAGGVLLFSRQEHTVSSPTQDQATFDLPADWGWPDREGAYALDANGAQIEKLVWLPWEAFRDLGSASASIPQYLSIFTEAEGVAHMNPRIDISRVGSLIVPYLTRIPQLAENDTLRLSPEARHSLRAWGKAYAMQISYKDKPDIYKPFFTHAEDTTRAAYGADSRRLGAEFASFTPDEIGRIPGANRAAPTGRVWIEI